MRNSNKKQLPLEQSPITALTIYVSRIFTLVKYTLASSIFVLLLVYILPKRSVSIANQTDPEALEMLNRLRNGLSQFDYIVIEGVNKDTLSDDQYQSIMQIAESMQMCFYPKNFRDGLTVSECLDRKYFFSSTKGKLILFRVNNPEPLELKGLFDIKMYEREFKWRRPIIFKVRFDSNRRPFEEGSILELHVVLWPG